jgi:hypothetical protein
LRGTGTAPGIYSRCSGANINTPQRDMVENHLHRANFAYFLISKGGASDAVLLNGDVAGTTSGAISTVSDGQSYSYNESRPYNYSVNWIIKL